MKYVYYFFRMLVLLIKVVIIGFALGYCLHCILLYLNSKK